MSETTLATAALFRSLTRRLMALLLAVAGLGALAGWLVAGAAGVWGALMAAGIAAFFLLTSVLVMRGTSRQPLHVVSAVLSGAWIVKVLVLLGALWLVGDADFYDRTMFLVTLFAAVIGTSVVEIVTVMLARVPTVDTGQRID